MECARRSVPNDNSCLFTAIAYLCDGGPGAVSDETQRRLRKVCADAAAADPDPEARALLLGQSVEDYEAWIAKPRARGAASTVQTAGAAERIVF